MARDIFLITHHLGGLGGVQRVVDQLAERFSQDGNRVTVIGCAIQKGEQYVPSEKHYTEILLYKEDIFFQKPWLFLKEKFFDKKLEKIIEDKLIQSENPILILANPIVYLLMEQCIKKWKNRAVFIGQMHSSSSFVLDCKGIYAVYPYIISQKYPNLDQILFLTESDAAVIQEYYQLPKDKMGAIPNPLPNYLVDSNVKHSPKKQLLSFVGRLDPVKQIDHAIQAFAIVSEEFPNWKFCIYGEGVERDKLQALIKSLGKEECIKLMGQTSQVATVYQESLLTILTSKSEAFPMAVVESMLLKTPVLSYSSSSGIQEIQSATPEMLVTKDSIAEMVEKLKYYFAHSEQLEGIAQSGFDYLSKTYTENAVIFQWYKLFERIERQK